MSGPRVTRLSEPQKSLGLTRPGAGLGDEGKATREFGGPT